MLKSFQSIQEVKKDFCQNQDLGNNAVKVKKQDLVFAQLQVEKKYFPIQDLSHPNRKKEFLPIHYHFLPEFLQQTWRFDCPWKGFQADNQNKENQSAIRRSTIKIYQYLFFRQISRIRNYNFQMSGRC